MILFTLIIFGITSITFFTWLQDEVTLYEALLYLLLAPILIPTIFFCFIIYHIGNPILFRWRIK